MSTRQEFWSRYYADVVKKGESWLDYSNERVQMQTFGLALEAAGPVRMKRCIDIGCGWGDLCRTLSTLRASAVTGVDIVPELIAEHSRAYPHIRWLCGSLHEPSILAQLASYDVAFLLEVLQLVPLVDTIRVIWNQLAPGGRIVAMVPNANCPIVSRTRQRFAANYIPPTFAEIDAVLQRRPDLERVAYRALWFRADQELVPYEVSSWRLSEDWDEEPNRIQFVALKRKEPGS